MFISLIAAVARNGVIGHEGRMPWKLPNDLRFFKQVTMGKPVILGRKTWESFGSKPLPGRPHIVLTANRDFTAEGAIVVHDLDTAIETGKRLAEEAGVEEVMVIGGAQIYAMTLALADRIFLTEIAASPPGDTHFPDFDRTAFLGEELALQMPEGPDRPAYRITLFHRR